MRPTHRARRAFTLIELTVVIIILAVLALILVPHIMGAGRKARESTLRAQLRQLREAVSGFKADCGDQPARLDGLLVRPAAGSRGGSGAVVAARSWHGPYLNPRDPHLPTDPFTGKDNWDYTAATGHVQSSSALSSLQGDPYSSW